MSSPSGHSSLVMCDNFGQIILMLSAALLLYDFFLYFVCIRVSALPGLQDRDERNAAEEKKRAYQLELQRQVHVCYLFGQWTGMSVICSDRYVCYLFGQICLLSVTCLDSLLSVWTGMSVICLDNGQVCLLFVWTGMSVICSDRYVCYLFGQVCLLSVWTDMSVICYLFGQSVTCSDRYVCHLLPVRTVCYLFGQSVICSDRYVCYLLPVRTVCYLFGQAVICSEWKNATIFSSFELLTCVGCLLVSLP